MSRLKELRCLVEEWATEKGIYDNSTHIVQLNGAIGELYEFRESVIKEHGRAKCMMELGDVMVFIINYLYLSGEESALFKDNGLTVYKDLYQVVELEEAIRDATITGVHVSIDYLVGRIYAISVKMDMDIAECLELAYQKISKRMGAMKKGKFVKSEDL